MPIPGLGVPGRVVTPRGQRRLAGRAVEMTPAILRALEAYFGGRYPYEKLDLIAVPEYWPGAMENPGAVTYSDRLLLIDVEVLPGGRMRLPPQRLTNAGVAAPPQTWRVPVALSSTRTAKGGHTRTVLLDGPSATFELGVAEVAWIYPHARATGYYRWRLPPDRLHRLRERAPERLTAAERVALIGNLSALLDDGILRRDVYLATPGRLADGPEADVVAALLGALGRVRPP